MYNVGKFEDGRRQKTIRSKCKMYVPKVITTASNIPFLRKIEHNEELFKKQICRPPHRTIDTGRKEAKEKDLWKQTTHS